MEPARCIEHLYSTPIQYVLLIDDDSLQIQKEMTEAVSKITWVKKEDWNNTHWLSSASFDDTFEYYNLKTFKTIMERELNNYCSELGFKLKPYKITSWFSKFERNDFGHAHNHGSADISGCYYFQTNGLDGNIYFLSPNLAAASSVPYGNRNLQWVHQPMVGKLLLFPGWLFHGIERNSTDNVRISFSFNITFER